MTLGLFAMAAFFLTVIALMAWEIVASRRAETVLRRELAHWYQEAWTQRRLRERAELGYGADMPVYLFPKVVWQHPIEETDEQRRRFADWHKVETQRKIERRLGLGDER